MLCYYLMLSRFRLLLDHFSCLSFLGKHEFEEDVVWRQCSGQDAVYTSLLGNGGGEHERGGGVS